MRIGSWRIAFVIQLGAFIALCVPWQAASAQVSVPPCRVLVSINGGDLQYVSKPPDFCQAATPTPSSTQVPPTATATPIPPTPTSMPVATATPPPSLTLQALVDAAPAGSTLSVPPGIYRETVTINKPLTLDGQHQAEIRGSDVWTAWSPSGSTWVSAQSYPDVGTDATAGTASCANGGPCYDNQFAAFNLEQVFIDGTPLTHVSSAPAAGQFALDSTRHVILGSNPGGHAVEVSTRKRWFNINAPNVTITNMTMHHAATGAFETGLSNDCQQGFVLSNSTLTDAHGSMLGSGCNGVTSTKILSNTLTNAGDLAIGGYQGSGTIIQGNVITHTGYGGWNPGWQAGAVKLFTQTNASMDGNTVSDSYGMGLWCDGHCNGVVYSNNKVHDVDGYGIFFEVSQNAHIFGNAVWNVGARLGADGIFVSSSGDAEVDHNTVYGVAANSIEAYAANRTDTAVVENNYFHDNIAVQLKDDNHKGMAWWDYAGGSIMSSTNEHGSNNAFWWPTPAGATYPNRFMWASVETPSLQTFNTTPGGGGNSYYLTDAQKDAALTAAGIPH